jgi:hypothetical protein
MLERGSASRSAPALPTAFDYPSVLVEAKLLRVTDPRSGA